MRVARVTSKGQVTVPKAIREALGVERGDILVFATHPQGYVKLRRLPGRTLTQLRGSLAGTRAIPHPQARKAYRRMLARRFGQRKSAR